MRGNETYKCEIRSLPAGEKAGDGGGLYYRPTATDRGQWSYIFSMDGKSHEMGSGTYPDMGLKEA